MCHQKKQIHVCYWVHEYPSRLPPIPERSSRLQLSEWFGLDMIKSLSHKRDSKQPSIQIDNGIHTGISQ